MLTESEAENFVIGQANVEVQGSQLESKLGDIGQNGDQEEKGDAAGLTADIEPGANEGAEQPQ